MDMNICWIYIGYASPRGCTPGVSLDVYPSGLCVTSLSETVTSPPSGIVSRPGCSVPLLKPGALTAFINPLLDIRARTLSDLDPGWPQDHLYPFFS